MRIWDGIKLGTVCCGWCQGLGRVPPPVGPRVKSRESPPAGRQQLYWRRTSRPTLTLLSNRMSPPPPPLFFMLSLLSLVFSISTTLENYLSWWILRKCSHKTLVSRLPLAYTLDSMTSRQSGKGENGRGLRPSFTVFSDIPWVQQTFCYFKLESVHQVCDSFPIVNQKGGIFLFILIFFFRKVLETTVSYFSLAYLFVLCSYINRQGN